MKLELKHIAPYLPYDLKMASTAKGRSAYVTTIKRRLKKVETLTPELIEVMLFLNRKPILRPLSDLSKRDLDFIYFEIISTDNDMYGNRDEFEDYFNETPIFHLPFCIYNYLLINHFDVFRLIEKGLAMDTNLMTTQSIG